VASREDSTGKGRRNLPDTEKIACGNISSAGGRSKRGTLHIWASEKKSAFRGDSLPGKFDAKD